MIQIKINYINKNTLLRIYKMFKSYPNRPFLARDFSLNHNKLRQTYLDVLKKLGLIKEVKVVYLNGKNRNAKHETIGYKLNNSIIFKKL